MSKLTECGPWRPSNTHDVCCQLSWQVPKHIQLYNAWNNPSCNHTNNIPNVSIVVVLWVECRTSNQEEVTGSTPTRALLHNNLGQVVHTLVSLSPSSTSWYQCKVKWGRYGNSRLWKRRGLPSITQSVFSQPAQDHRNSDEHCTHISQRHKRVL